MKARIFHNPQCSKSCETLSLLEEKGLVPELVDYLSTPLSTEELQSICTKLQVHPLKIIRVNDALFSELGYHVEDERSDSEWLDIVASEPRLLQRPIVLVGNKAVIGRPPELVLEIL